jgi:putative component of toxin-antitoxin plasmid stabilization module
LSDVFLFQNGAVLIVMLGGGDKSTQATDILQAIQLAATVED